MDNLSQLRLAENEVIFRKVNEEAKVFIADTKGVKASVRFYCECSRTDCRRRISMTVEDYEKSHTNPRQFVVISGHDIPEIEKIVSKENGYDVIEKYGNPPSQKEITAALKDLNPPRQI